MRFSELRYTVKSNNASLCANLSDGEHLNYAAEGRARAPVWGLSGERVRFGRHSAHTVRMTDRQVYYGHVKPNETRARECVKIARERICIVALNSLSVCAMRTRRTHDLSNIIALSHWNAIILLSAVRQGGGLRCGWGAQVEISKLKTPSRADSQTATLRIIYNRGGAISLSLRRGMTNCAKSLFNNRFSTFCRALLSGWEPQRCDSLIIDCRWKSFSRNLCRGLSVAIQPPRGRIKMSRRRSRAQPKLLIPAEF